MSKPVWASILVTGAVILGAVGYASLRRLHAAVTAVPVATVKRGDIALTVYTSGTLNAQKVARLVAPQVTGGEMTVIKLLPTGSAVKAGGVVAAFDPGAEEYNLQEARAELGEAQKEIAKAGTDAKVQAAEDRSQLLSDQYEVDKAAIKVKTNELYSAIDAQQNILALDQAKRALAELRADVKSHSTSGQATLAVAEQDRQKALFAIQQALQDIKNMTVCSPIAGLVEVEKNYWANGGIFFEGEELPEFRVGDEAFSGMSVAQVIDPSRIEVHTAVTETDRANIRIGQRVEIHVDSMPHKVFYGKITAISGSASRGSIFSDLPPTVATFGVTVQFTEAPAGSRPGETAHLVIQGTALSGVLYLPPQAVFQVNGNPVVYVKKESGFEAQRVKVKYRTATQIVIEGVERGAIVALVNPEKKNSGTPPARPGMALPQGGE